MFFDFSRKEEKKAFSLIKEKYAFVQQFPFLKKDLPFENFKKRYLEAQKKKINMAIFFEVENEAIDQFLNKIKVEQEKKNQVAEEQEEQEQEEDVIEDIYKRISENIKKYERVKIHKNATEEAERLLGALIDFRKNFVVGLKKLKDVFGQIGLGSNYDEMLVELDNLGYVRKSHNLPLAFNSFRFILEIYENNEIENEKAKINVFKQVILFFKKVKKLIFFLEKNLFDKKKVFYKKVPYLGTTYFVDDYLNVLSTRSNDILNDFRLNEFS